MHRGERMGRQRERHQPAALSGHAKSLAEQRLRRSRSERNDDLRLDDADLGLEPRKAGLDLDRARLAVDAPRSARHPFEVLDDIGDVGLRRDRSPPRPGSGRAVSGRPDKRVAGEVFGIARLFADQHHPRPLRAFAEHGLCGVPVQIASRAAGGGFPQRADCRLGRDLGRRRWCLERAITLMPGSNAYSVNAISAPSYPGSE